MKSQLKKRENKFLRFLGLKIRKLLTKGSRPKRYYVNKNAWIPFEIDLFLKGKLYDHREFTFLYLKHHQEDHVMFQTLLLILIDGGPTKYASFPTNLMSRVVNRLDFLRRLRHELDFVLNHVPLVSENGVTREAKHIFIYPAGTIYGSGEKRSTYNAKYIMTEVIKWIDVIALPEEINHYKNFIEQPKKPQGFRFNLEKWDQKDLLMVARIMTTVEGIEFDEGVIDEDYYRAFCDFHSVQVSEPAASISMSKSRETLHKLLNEYLKIQKELDIKAQQLGSKAEIPFAKRKLKGLSKIDFKNSELT